MDFDFTYSGENYCRVNQMVNYSNGIIGMTTMVLS